MKLMTETSVITKAIESIANRGKKLDSDIHKAACSILSHLVEHRDSTLVTRLVAAMPKSSRRKALIDWYERLVPMTVNYQTGKAELAKEKSNEWREFVAKADEIVKAAIAKPFWEKEEKGEKDKLTFEAVLKYLHRKANSKDADDITARKLSELVAFADRLAKAEASEGEAEEKKAA